VYALIWRAWEWWRDTADQWPGAGLFAPFAPYGVGRVTWQRPERRATRFAQAAGAAAMSLRAPPGGQALRRRMEGRW